MVVLCKMGGRSAQAVAFLRQQGFENVHNLEGGILAWIDMVRRNRRYYLRPRPFRAPSGAFALAPLGVP